MIRPIQFTVITPTVQRPSLRECCHSVDEQTYPHWLHVVMVDCATLDLDLLNSVQHDERSIIQCAAEHCNSGNTCRHIAWESSIPESWLIMLDDDNFLSDPTVLADIAAALESANRPDWITFPMLRFGGVFFNDPPGLCLSDTANVCVRRAIGRWPNINDYTADGHYINALRDNSELTFRAFPNLRPMIVMPVHSKGVR